MKEELSPGKTLASGEIEIEFRRRPISGSSNMEKIQEVGERLKNEVITGIKRFNAENSGKASLSLSANIRGRKNNTVLHAAVQLRREDMVKTLLDLGAKPNEKSNIGTPHSLASLLRDRSLEKCENYATLGDDGRAQEQQDVYDVFQRILTLLRKKKALDQLPSDIAESLTKNTNDEHELVDPVVPQSDFDILEEVFASAPESSGKYTWFY